MLERAFLMGGIASKPLRFLVNRMHLASLTDATPQLLEYCRTTNFSIIFISNDSIVRRDGSSRRLWNTSARPLMDSEFQTDHAVFLPHPSIYEAVSKTATVIFDGEDTHLSTSKR